MKIFKLIIAITALISHSSFATSIVTSQEQSRWELEVNEQACSITKRHPFHYLTGQRTETEFVNIQFNISSNNELSLKLSIDEGGIESKHLPMIILAGSKFFPEEKDSTFFLDDLESRDVLFIMHELALAEQKLVDLQLVVQDKGLHRLASQVKPGVLSKIHENNFCAEKLASIISLNQAEVVQAQPMLTAL